MMKHVLTALVSLLLLLVGSITPLRAQSLMEMLWSEELYKPAGSPIHGSNLLFADGSVRGSFVLQVQETKDGVRFITLTPQRWSVSCTNSGPEFRIEGTAQQRGAGGDYLMIVLVTNVGNGLYTMPLT